MICKIVKHFGVNLYKTVVRVEDKIGSLVWLTSWSEDQVDKIFPDKDEIVF